MGCCSVENQIISSLPVDLNMLSFCHEKLVMWVGVHLFQLSSFIHRKNCDFPYKPNIGKCFSNAFLGMESYIGKQVAFTPK